MRYSTQIFYIYARRRNIDEDLTNLFRERLTLEIFI
jgi:hypothetical protein